MKDTKTSLKSKDWLKHDRNFISDRFTDIGFEYAEEVMELRVFDLLNLNRIDAEAAREMILALYRRFNPNPFVDEGIEEKLIDQNYPFTLWRSRHKDLSKVLVRDLVMADNINQKAIIHFYNSILKAFFKSKEYSSREYRFRDYWELLQSDRRKEQ